MLKYESVSELVAEAEKRNIKISELVLEDQAKSMEKEPIEGIKKHSRPEFRIGLERSYDTGQIRRLAHVFTICVQPHPGQDGS